MNVRNPVPATLRERERERERDATTLGAVWFLKNYHSSLFTQFLALSSKCHNLYDIQSLGLINSIPKPLVSGHQLETKEKLAIIA